MDGLIKEAVEYAKKNKGFSRILQEIMMKYKSIGRFSGSIFLPNISEEESKILGAIDYRLFGKKEGKLNIKKFIDYFSGGKFKDLCFEDFMKEYFKGEFITNRELKDREQEKRQEFFNGIYNLADDRKLGVSWLKEAVKEKSYGYGAIIKEYDIRREELKQKLLYVIKAIDSLSFKEDKLEPLPLFSSRITKDPHYFDIGTTSFRLLMSALCYILQQKYPENVEETNEILYKVGIARDEISIFTTIYGISALSDQGEHKGWEGFYQNGEPLHVSIRNLNSISELKIKGRIVYIFENPTVFMEVIRHLENNDIKERPALICTSGQLNTASLLLLDKLNKKAVTFFYSGDFDPEGLLIADKLKSRYKEKLLFWRYSKEDYFKIKGNKDFHRRENMLNSLKSPELLELKQVMEREKHCGYQELLINEYIEDIKEEY